MTGLIPTFRLLDVRTGWDPRPTGGLDRIVLDEGALRLAAATPAGTGAMTRRRPRPVLARSRDGTWWLGGRWGLFRLDPCDDRFCPWRERHRVLALATCGERLAVVLVSGVVEVFHIGSGLLLARAVVPGAAAVAIGPEGRLEVVDRHGLRTELDPSGLVCRAERCRPGDDIPPAPPDPPVPAGATVGADGFCLEGRGCFDWRGRRASATGPQTGAVYQTRGQYLSLALDSGIPGCRWHRIRLDADVPDGTTVEIAFATTDGPAEGRPETPPVPGEWSDFPAGEPHPTDWYIVTPGSTDSTLGAAPGRYGFLRLRLTGDGDNTPAVHQVRLDLPRATGIDRCRPSTPRTPRPGTSPSGS